MDDTSVDDPIVVKADSFPFLSHWNMLFIFYNWLLRAAKDDNSHIYNLFRTEAILVVSQIKIDYCVYR